ncbi:mariner transposase [Senna tora]|uniref:Mariner transposase n=1 Tax=Senna tora TaxID=362788 RepID=A0A834WPL1_9FABA|nr:mariner transposase [Senna tora]
MGSSSSQPISNVVVDVSHRKGNCGRKRVQVDLDKVRDIPLNQRSTLCSLACALKIGKNTVHRLLKSRMIRRHSNAIKPILKEENMRNYYMLVDEEDPIRSCKSKNFIAKVMFLVALARPRFDAQGRELFSGKIGIFPLVTKEPTKRTSVNRAAGTLETKPIASINKEVIRSYLIQKVLPAIKEKWPREDMGCPIFIQQDNARTHIDLDDEEFCRVASEDGFDI